MSFTREEEKWLSETWRKQTRHARLAGRTLGFKEYMSFKWFFKDFVRAFENAGFEKDSPTPPYYNAWDAVDFYISREENEEIIETQFHVKFEEEVEEEVKSLPDLLKKLGTPSLPELDDPYAPILMEELVRELAERLKDAEELKGKIRVSVAGKTRVWGAGKIHDFINELHLKIRSLEAERERLLREVPKPQLSEADRGRLRDLFVGRLKDRLGRVPENALAEFEAEWETMKTVSYGSAAGIVERLAREVIEYEEKVKIPKVPVRPRVVEIGVPEEMLVYPVELPKAPLSPLPFPRSITSDEEPIFWNHFRYEMARLGTDVLEYRERYRERVKLPYRSWSDLVKTYTEFIADIEAGRPISIIPLLARVTMPWREDTEENWRYDAIVHLTSTGLYKTIDELIYSTEPPGLQAYGVMAVTPEEVRKAIEKGWKEKSLWFVGTLKQDLEAFIGEKVE